MYYPSSPDRQDRRARVQVRARGRLERREGTINVIVAGLGPLEYRPVEESGGPAVTQIAAQARERAQLRARELAVAELRAVAPAGHSFGRRGR